jgi:hypothetical protein
LVSAIREAAQRDGIVHAIHVWRRPARQMPGPAANPNEARDAAEALLLEAIESIPDRRGARISSYAVEGDPAEVLLRYCVRADVVILGRRGPGPASVYWRCARLAACRVTVAAEQPTSWPEPGVTVADLPVAV